MKNYYDLIEIPRDVPAEEMDRVLRDARRMWRQLAGSSDLEQRSRAEQAMQAIAEARPILTDPEKKAAYDAEAERLADSQRTPGQRPGSESRSAGQRNVLTGLLERAVDAWERQDLSEAGKLTDLAVAQFPDSASAWTAKAQAAARQGDRNSFVSAARRAWELSPESIEAWTLATGALAVAGERQRVVDMCRAQLDRHPGDLQVQMACSRLLCWVGDYDAALDYGRHIMEESHPDSAEARLNYAHLLWADLESRIDVERGFSPDTPRVPLFLGPTQSAFATARIAEIRETAPADPSLEQRMRLWEACLQEQSIRTVGWPGGGALLKLVLWFYFCVGFLPGLADAALPPGLISLWGFHPITVALVLVGVVRYLSLWNMNGWQRNRKATEREDSLRRKAFRGPSLEDLML